MHILWVYLYTQIIFSDWSKQEIAFKSVRKNTIIRHATECDDDKKIDRDEFLDAESVSVLTPSWVLLVFAEVMIQTLLEKLS